MDTKDGQGIAALAAVVALAGACSSDYDIAVEGQWSGPGVSFTVDNPGNSTCPNCYAELASLSVSMYGCSGELLTVHFNMQSITYEGNRSFGATSLSTGLSVTGTFESKTTCAGTNRIDSCSLSDDWTARPTPPDAGPP